MKGALKCFVFRNIYNYIAIIPLVITLTALKLVFYSTFSIVIFLLFFTETLIFLKFVKRTRELKSKK